MCAIFVHLLSIQAQHGPIYTISILYVKES